MVHQYQLNGYNIVLDTCSGAIHVVDEVAYDIIALYPDHTADEIVTAMMEKYGEREDVTEQDLRNCIDDVEALKQAGKLYTPDTFADMAGTFKERSGDVVKALCLHVAHTCNLNCSYCFASQGKYHGDRALMSFEVGKQALDFLMDHSGSRTNLEVDFFGGEPLMNWDVVKQLVEYARSVEKERGKNFRFTLTTNGMLIDDDVIDFANREMSNVVLSLDGRKEIHDRLRVDYAGNGSYERIVPKFQKLVEARGNKNYYMRGTFTHANPDFTKDLFHMADLGFTELSMEPVVCAPEDPAALTAEDLEIVKDQYELLAKDMLRREKEGKPITFYHYMLDLTGGPCIYKRISGCGSGTEYMAVTPWGDLYPCHQFVGEEAYKLGDIWNGVTNTALREEFRSCNAYARPECNDCWARFYCSGGCAANAFHATGSIRGVYEAGCELFRKRIECAIMMKVAEDSVDFVRRYANSGMVRAHMPGHKGKPFLGCEALDITEIRGADSLYEADGIIRRSESYAGDLFGSGRTVYSTEGSSQCIRAMLYLALTCGNGSRTVVVARNVHRAFVYAAALLDFEIVWLWPERSSSLCGCPVSPEALERTLASLPAPPAAVYLTSPDYLGDMADISAVAEVCRKHGTLLAVDNAHGAYLRFLEPSCHPLDLGADLCCDSAHKTLPVLTGGAYLHISRAASASLRESAKTAMAMFGSTSPSYLTLASLDLCNRYLADGYRGSSRDDRRSAGRPPARERRGMRIRRSGLSGADADAGESCGGYRAACVCHRNKRRRLCAAAVAAVGSWRTGMFRARGTVCPTGDHTGGAVVGAGLRRPYRGVSACDPHCGIR